jgi:hypothetical protein
MCLNEDNSPFQILLNSAEENKKGLYQLQAKCKQSLRDRSYEPESKFLHTALLKGLEILKSRVGVTCRSYVRDYYRSRISIIGSKAIRQDTYKIGIAL